MKISKDMIIDKCFYSPILGPPRNQDLWIQVRVYLEPKTLNFSAQVGLEWDSP